MRFFLLTLLLFVSACVAPTDPSIITELGKATINGLSLDLPEHITVANPGDELVVSGSCDPHHSAFTVSFDSGVSWKAVEQFPAVSSIRCSESGRFRFTIDSLVRYIAFDPNNHELRLPVIIRATFFNSRFDMVSFTISSGDIYPPLAPKIYTYSDHSSPTVEIIDHPSNKDVAGFECRIDGQEWYLCQSGDEILMPLHSREYNIQGTLEVRSYDYAGNRSPVVNADYSRGQLPIFDGPIYDLIAAENGQITVAGAFSTYQALYYPSVLPLDSNFNPQIEQSSLNLHSFNTTNLLILPSKFFPGKFYAYSNELTHYNGNAVGQVVRLNSLGVIDPDFTFQSSIKDYYSKIAEDEQGNLYFFDQDTNLSKCDRLGNVDLSFKKVKESSAYSIRYADSILYYHYFAYDTRLQQFVENFPALEIDAISANPTSSHQFYVASTSPVSSFPSLPPSSGEHKLAQMGGHLVVVNQLGIFYSANNGLRFTRKNSEGPSGTYQFGFNSRLHRLVNSKYSYSDDFGKSWVSPLGVGESFNNLALSETTADVFLHDSSSLYVSHNGGESFAVTALAGFYNSEGRISYDQSTEKLILAKRKTAGTIQILETSDGVSFSDLGELAGSSLSALTSYQGTVLLASGNTLWYRGPLDSSFAQNSNSLPYSSYYSLFSANEQGVWMAYSTTAYLLPWASLSGGSAEQKFNSTLYSYLKVGSRSYFGLSGLGVGYLDDPLPDGVISSSLLSKLNAYAALSSSSLHCFDSNLIYQEGSCPKVKGSVNLVLDFANDELIVYGSGVELVDDGSKKNLLRFSPSGDLLSTAFPSSYPNSIFTLPDGKMIAKPSASSTLASSVAYNRFGESDDFTLNMALSSRALFYDQLYFLGNDHLLLFSKTQNRRTDQGQLAYSLVTIDPVTQRLSRQSTFELKTGSSFNLPSSGLHFLLNDPSDSNALFIGGGFRTIGGHNTQAIARIKLETTGFAIDSAFSSKIAGTTPFISQLLIDSNRLIAANPSPLSSSSRSLQLLTLAGEMVSGPISPSDPLYELKDGTWKAILQKETKLYLLGATADTSNGFIEVDLTGQTMSAYKGLSDSAAGNANSSLALSLVDLGDQGIGVLRTGSGRYWNGTSLSFFSYFFKINSGFALASQFSGIGGSNDNSRLARSGDFFFLLGRQDLKFFHRETGGSPGVALTCDKEIRGVKEIGDYLYVFGDFTRCNNQNFNHILRLKIKNGYSVDLTAFGVMRQSE